MFNVLGVAADMKALSTVARTFGLKVVADAACALGTSHQGNPVAQMGADLSVISFNGNKTVTSGGGGAVVGIDGKLLAVARHLSTTARQGSEYEHDQVGFNYRMTNLQAAVGCAQMERLDVFLAAKRRIRAVYDRDFSDLGGAEPFPGGSGIANACWLSGIVARDAATATRLRAHLASAGIEARSFWRSGRAHV